ncbi:hypothetical protein EAI89_20815 [Eubacterium sp. am_0171]|nr:hypothetical protein EAI89_20815 [Eubacterium sp. am_0171]
MKRLDNPAKMCIIALDWTGLDWTGLDWTGLDWTGLDWTGLDKGNYTLFSAYNFNTVRILRHDPGGIPPDGGRGAFLYASGGDAP